MNVEGEQRRRRSRGSIKVGMTTYEVGGQALNTLASIAAGSGRGE